MKVASPTDITLLNNPIWCALSTDQSCLAQSNHLAKRFPRDVAPFGAMKAQSAAEYEALAQILGGDTAALFLDTKPTLPADWSMRISGDMFQMTFEAPPPAISHQVIRKLTHADVPDMLALTKLTEPGPFLPRTIELGSYYGIHKSGSLVAMAGERLRLTGFTEVSAVCTHPNFRGRGYGNALMSTVISGILNRGETPFLHVKTDNPAIALYKKLGFQIRTQLYLAVIQQTAPEPTNKFANAIDGTELQPHPEFSDISTTSGVE
jgi:ribosomal protein S18 acetylase RimI-like enzyme